MDRERYQKVRDILLELLDLPEQKRESEAAKRCGSDEELRAEVLDLLGQQTRGALRDVLPLPVESPSRIRIDSYEIGEMLGAGGMGAVYKARQTSPIQRDVALKLIRGGLADGHAVARFEVERQVLASLSHPHIAQVYDAGSSDDGLPYFAMELVEGVPITDHCSDRNFGPRSCVRLFIQVCRAVQHAHNKGVIHRDLKPSNILVAEHQGRPVPKIIDFGIAKALDAGEDYVTMMTRDGKLVGTLEYMSPEQISGGTGGLDIRSDVYALGVVLYQLLAERLPFDLAGLSVVDAMRTLADGTPTRLTATTSGAGVPRDLELIVMKALEKEPGRRYQNAADLATDLERFLGGEPVSARAPSATYQVRRLIARHRILFGSAAVLVLASTAFSVGMAVLYSRQQSARRAAVEEAAEAREIGDFLARMIGSVDRLEKGRDVTVAELLESVSATVDDEVSLPEARVSVQRALATGFFALGRYAESRQHYQAAVEALRRREGPPSADLFDALDSIVANSYYLGDYDAAIMTCEELVRLRHEHAPRSDGLGVTLNNLSRLLLFNWRFAEAESTAREAVAVHVNNGREGTTDHLVAYSGIPMILYEAGEFAKSLKARRSSVALRERYLGEDNDWTFGSRVALAQTLHDLGQVAQAESLIFDLAANLPTKDFTREGLTRCEALIALHDGRNSEAISLMRQAVAERAVSIGATSPRMFGYNADLGYVLLRSGAIDEALILVDLAVDQAVQSPRRDHPNVAVILSLQGACLDAANRHTEAAGVLGEALQIFDSYELAEHWQAVLARSRLAGCMVELGRREEASALFSEVRPAMDRLPYAIRVFVLTEAVRVCDENGDLELATAFRTDLSTTALKLAEH